MHTYISKILQQNCIVKCYIYVCAVLFCIILVHFSWLVAPAEIAADVAKQLFGNCCCCCNSDDALRSSSLSNFPVLLLFSFLHGYTLLHHFQ